MDEAWAQARVAWEGGEPLGEVAERLGLARSTLYQKAQAWKAETGEALPPPAPFDPWTDAAPTGELLELATKRATHAVRAGRAADALAWLRLSERLEAKARREEWAETLAAMTPHRTAASPDATKAQAAERMEVLSLMGGSLDSAESSGAAPAEPPEASPESAQAPLAREAWRKLQAARAGSSRGPPGRARR